MLVWIDRRHRVLFFHAVPHKERPLMIQLIAAGFPAKIAQAFRACSDAADSYSKQSSLSAESPNGAFT